MTSTQYLTISCIVAILLVPQLIALYLSGPRKTAAEAYDFR
jgi:hypothetical protein